MALVLGMLSPLGHYERPLGFEAYGDLKSEHFVDNQILLQSCIYRKFDSTLSYVARHAQAKVVALADARIFNRQAIQTELALHSKTISDSELILHAYLKWGTDCLAHLIGDFAFAIWDASQNQLFLASDHAGQRSFYYTFAYGKFYFSNLIRPLFEYYGIERSLNTTKIADFMTIISTNASHTFFNSIQTIPAAHYLLIKPGKEPKLIRYWSAQTIKQNPLQLNNTQEYYAYFSDLFKEVMQERMGSLEQNGYLLSGGLDSSALVATAAHLTPSQHVHAFCHIPITDTSRPLKNFDYDETIYIQALQDKYPNLIVNFLRDDQNYLFEYCNDLHPWLGQPPLNPTNMLWILKGIQQAEKQGIKTLLTGQSGNFTISWGGPKSMSTTLIGRAKKKWQIEKTNLALLLRKRGHKPWGYYSAISDQLAQSTGLLARHCKPMVIDYCHPLDNRLEYIEDGNFGMVAASHALFRFLYGVDMTDPTCDKRIVEFCLRSPDHLFRDKTATRLLVRHGLANLLPPLIRQRCSRGIQSADWYRKVERQKNEITDLLASWQLTPLSDYIDVSYLSKQFKNWNYHKVKKSQGRKYNYFTMEYQAKLLRAIEIGLFIKPNLL